MKKILTKILWRLTFKRDLYKYLEILRLGGRLTLDESNYLGALLTLKENNNYLN